MSDDLVEFGKERSTKERTGSIFKPSGNGGHIFRKVTISILVLTNRVAR